jgi:hypothetical protein
MSDDNSDAEDLKADPKGGPRRRIELGDLATNQILYALALLGVLLPSNAILSHFSQIGFTYSQRSWLFEPAFTWHVHAISFIYAMEGFLAIAVYLYGYDFLFGLRFFHTVGTYFYAGALIVPPTYIICYGYANLSDLTLRLNGVWYWIIPAIGGLLLGVFIGVAEWAVVSRLGRATRLRPT